MKALYLVIALICSSLSAGILFSFTFTNIILYKDLLIELLGINILFLWILYLKK